MSEAKLLRTLADKIEHLEAVQEFSGDIVEPGNLTVSWTNGLDGPGYAVLSEAISELVKTHWAALRSQVVKQRETEVQLARTEWSALGGAKKSVESAPASTVVGAEASLRRAAA